MALGDQRHTVRLPLPDFVVRDRAHTISAPVYLDGALVVPTSWSVAVYNASNTSVETGSGSGAASHTIGSGDLTAETLGSGWRVEWTITLPDGTVLHPRNDAMLVRSGLWPVVTDADLYRREPSLDPGGVAPVTSRAGFQGYLDEAWTELQLRLIGLGRRPYLIMEPSALRQPHLYLALSLIFAGEASRLSDAWEQKADRYNDLYSRAWDSLAPHYDEDDDGQADSRRKSLQPTVWLNGGDRARHRFPNGSDNG